MPSKTLITWKRRDQRRDKAGKERKARNRNQGTTPPFPVHTPEIDAAAPPAQVSPSAKK
jgi:hypothetical protein